MKEEIIKALSYVRRSQHRSKVLLAINDDVLMPSDISKKLNIRPTHISRALKGLKEEKIVVCLNEEEIRGRLFKVTELGKEVIKEMNKIKIDE
ncbi:MAG: MarR family transcriptional regulator [Methanobacteriaceae archaeon]